MTTENKQIWILLIRSAGGTFRCLHRQVLTNIVLDLNGKTWSFEDVKIPLVPKPRSPKATKYQLPLEKPAHLVQDHLGASLNSENIKNPFSFQEAVVVHTLISILLQIFCNATDNVSLEWVITHLVLSFIIVDISNKISIRPNAFDYNSYSICPAACNPPCQSRTWGIDIGMIQLSVFYMLDWFTNASVGYRSLMNYRYSASYTLRIQINCRFCIYEGNTIVSSEMYEKATMRQSTKIIGKAKLSFS